jgi:hypothetical protein
MERQLGQPTRFLPLARDRHRCWDGNRPHPIGYTTAMEGSDARARRRRGALAALRGVDERGADAAGRRPTAGSRAVGRCRAHSAVQLVIGDDPANRSLAHRRPPQRGIVLLGRVQQGARAIRSRDGAQLGALRQPLACLAEPCRRAVPDGVAVGRDVGGAGEHGVRVGAHGDQRTTRQIGQHACERQWVRILGAPSRWTGRLQPVASGACMRIGPPGYSALGMR